jgi:hypothetical protein
MHISPQDRKEMLADARDPKRLEAFRKAKRLQEEVPVSLTDYYVFLKAINRFFPPDREPENSIVGQDFRL